MSRIKVDRITDKAGTGSPTLVNGLNVTGKSTMGDIVGAAVTFNSITGGSANFSSNVSIGGTLTYEDVTNIDSVGLITARDGIRVTAGDVAIGLANPGLKLHIQDGELPSAPTPNSNCDVVIEGTTNTGIQFLSGTQTQLRFGDADSTAAGSIIYRHTDDNFRLNFSNSGYLSIYDGGGENLRFTPNNEIGIAGANYGTSGQVLTSGGSGAAVQWATPAGGSWEVLATTDFATSPANYSESRGWTTNYQTVKLVYSFLRQTSANSDCSVRFYMHTAYGNNGTLKTAQEYKWGVSSKDYNQGALSNGGANDAERWRLFGGGGGQYWSGEITFRIGTGVPGYNYAKAAWGWTERESTFALDSCKYDTDTNEVIVGARIYNDDGSNFSEGRATWYGIKYS